MDFKDQIKQLAEKLEKSKSKIHNEEQTKHSLIMPFIQILGYDVFDPSEVVPEFVADLGIKKGEKVDYAIFMNGEPTILIECKHSSENLDPHNSQLFRYFHVSKAKFGILTNGIVYRFYTDLLEANKMDEKPFLEVNITDLKDNHVEEVKKFHKSYFDLSNIVSTANELKYTNEFKILIQNEFNSPSDIFIRHFAKQVYTGALTAKQMELFGPMVKKSLSQYVSDLITDRLKSALEIQTEAEPISTSSPIPEIAEENKIVTTPEEMDAFYIVRAILRRKIAIDRVVYRDAQSYFAILLDDNRLKTICRLYFNGSKKYIGIIDDQKKETKNEIINNSDIYNFEESLIKTVDFYETSKH
jgi:predicted type IV restriction endonuclease